MSDTTESFVHHIVPIGTAGRVAARAMKREALNPNTLNQRLDELHPKQEWNSTIIFVLADADDLPAHGQPVSDGMLPVLRAQAAGAIVIPVVGGAAAEVEEKLARWDLTPIVVSPWASKQQFVTDCAEAVRAIGRLIFDHGMINVDSADVRRLFAGGGLACLATGSAPATPAWSTLSEATSLALEEMESWPKGPGFDHMLISFSAGPGTRLREINDAATQLEAVLKPTGELIFGVYTEAEDAPTTVTVIASTSRVGRARRWQTLDDGVLLYFERGIAPERAALAIHMLERAFGHNLQIVAGDLPPGNDGLAHDRVRRQA